MDLGALLDAGDNAAVTLVAGDTRLVAHRAVLAAGSPVLAAMLAQEASSGEVAVPDVEGPVLRELLSHLYTRRAPQLSGAAPQLLAAADVYGVTTLKAVCERQAAAQLTVETAAAAAVLAVRHSCTGLTKAAIDFIKSHTHEVMGTQGWADAVHTQPEYLVEVSRLLSETPDETSGSHVSEPAATEPAEEEEETAAPGLGSLLDAGEGAVVTLVAGDTRLAVHRAVLAASSPGLAAMLDQDTPEARRGEVAIPDLDGRALRQLVSYWYTQRATQLPAAAHKYVFVREHYELPTEIDSPATADSGTAPATQPKSDDDQTAASGAPPTASCKCRKRNDATVNRLRSLTGEEKGKRLIEAAESGAVQELSMLLEAGADVAARGDDGETALHRAAGRGHLEAASVLLAAGAEVEARGRAQTTPLHWAAVNGHAAAVALLAGASADLDARDQSGWTPLHYAASSGRADAVVALLQAGADRGATSNCRDTPFDIAQVYNHQQLADMLR